MKTAISLPDDAYERASQRARDLGVSRSQFFADAARRYLDELDAQSLSDQIDTALDHVADSEDSADAAVGVGHRRLTTSDDEW